MNPATLATLTTEFLEAIRLVMRDLFHAFPRDDFYYFSLVTQSEVLGPYFSACSVQGMSQFPPDWRWSLPDSPHVFFGQHDFARVERLFELRMSRAGEDDESAARSTAMMRALWRADQAGFFGDDPEKYLINVEILGADAENLERLCLLNRASPLRHQRVSFHG